jgi:hypothetical protein
LGNLTLVFSEPILGQITSDYEGTWSLGNRKNTPKPAQSGLKKGLRELLVTFNSLWRMSFLLHDIFSAKAGPYCHMLTLT